jgi:hypothetical protein
MEQLNLEIELWLQELWVGHWHCTLFGGCLVCCKAVVKEKRQVGRLSFGFGNMRHELAAGQREVAGLGPDKERGVGLSPQLAVKNKNRNLVVAE